MAKSAEVFARELCRILDKISPKNKQFLFNTIFKIFEQDAEKALRVSFGKLL